MFLLFNMLSMFVIAFLPRSKCLLISWPQSPSAVILEPPKIKSDTVSTVSPSISHEVMGPELENVKNKENFKMIRKQITYRKGRGRQTDLSIVAVKAENSGMISLMCART